MAVTCAHCGTVNPDGNTICSSCGMPLIATAAASDSAADAQAEAPGSGQDAPAADRPGVALPVLDEPIATPAAGTAELNPRQDAMTYLPPGYVPGTSPYLPAPGGAAAPIHRTGHVSAVAVVGIISVVFGGAGAVVAALRTGATSSASVASAPANVPPDTTPAGATTPPSSTSATITTTPFATVSVPPGFSVNDQGADYIVLTPDSSDSEAVGMQSESLTSTRTNAQLDEDLLAGDQQNGDPGAKFCTAKPPAHTQLIGAGGPITADIITICENVTPTGGPAFAAVDGFVDAVAKTSSGGLEAIWVEIFAPQGDYQSFSNSLPTGLFTQTTFTNANPAT